jgi:heme A synthase
MRVDRRYAYFAWGVLGYSILVILWGAFVRATGSGAGCGSHWPLCNGVVVPRATQAETMIEFAHRLTSGLSVVLIALLIVWGWRLSRPGHPVRKTLIASGVFIILEALIGAWLVLAGLTADNDSVGRAISMALHLINTFLLLAALAFTAWWASGGERIRLAGRGWLLAGWLMGLVAVIIVGMSGAVTALGDTLFPSASINEGFRADFSDSRYSGASFRRVQAA